MNAAEQALEYQRVYDIVATDDYLVLDTETTGLDTGEICEICIIDSTGMVVLFSLIKPVNGIPAAATAIHGITNDRVKESPTFAEIAPQLIQVLTERNILVYNAVYDRKMLHKSAEAAGIAQIPWKTISRWFCVMEAFAVAHNEYNGYRDNYKWQKLSQAADFYNVAITDAHSALGDCRATLAVCKAMGKAPRLGDEATI